MRKLSMLVTIAALGGAAVGALFLIGCSQTTDQIEISESNTPDMPELELDDTPSSENGWQERSFAGNSIYTIQHIDGQPHISGTTDGTASLLYRKSAVDLNNTPTISWRWKISNTYSPANEREKNGDDYPARLYVAAQVGLLPWDIISINYVWSSNNPVGSTWDNAFTEKAKMLVLQSGTKNVNTWQQESRNVRADFKALFGEDITVLDGYAVMIDGDNTGSSGKVWFSDIQFHKADTADNSSN